MNIEDIKNGRMEEDEYTAEIVKLDPVTNASPIPETEVTQDTIQSTGYKKVSIEEMLESGQFNTSPIIDETQQKIIDNYNKVVDINGPIQDSINRRSEQIANNIHEMQLNQELNEETINKSEEDEYTEYETDDDFDADYEEGVENMNEEIYAEPYEEKNVATKEELENQIKHHQSITKDKTSLGAVGSVIYNKPAESNMYKIVPINDAITTSDTEYNDYDEDLKALESVSSTVSEEDKEREEVLNKMKVLVNEKFFKTAEKKLDISGFTILNKPISLNNSISMIKSKAARKWALIYSGIPILMSYLEVDEMEDLSQNYADYIESKNLNSLVPVLRSFYDHITSPKPAKFESWLRVIDSRDLDSLFMSVYNSLFKDINYIPYLCTNKDCKEVFLTDDIPIESLCKFKNDEVKNRFYEILHSESTIESSSLYVSEVEPINFDYAISIKNPSLFDTTMGVNFNDAKFNEKYGNIINIIPYIDNMYKIDRDDRTVQPISYKIFPESVEKTTKSKIITYAKIIRQMDADDYYRLLILITEYAKNLTTDIVYIMPGITCPNCGEKSRDSRDNAADLLFMRHRLVGYNLF